MTRLHRIAAASAAFLASAALAAQATAAPPDWTAIAQQAEHAVYALEVGHAVPLDLIAGYPSWLGTGFQVRTPSGQTLEITACHLVCYQTKTGNWTSWAQVFVAPIGTAGFLHPDTFTASDTAMFTNVDVAESAHAPQRRITRLLALVRGGDPAVRGYLALGDYAALPIGTQLLVLGNRSGGWDANGYRPFPQVGTYVGQEEGLHEASDNSAFPSLTLPDVLAITGSFRPGDSGAPVIDETGRVVGVFVAANQYMGFAVPLDPNSGTPVDGMPVSGQ